MKRDIKNKLLFGVCAGLANYFHVDPIITRAIFAIATLMGVGLPIIVYLVLAVLMPPDE